MVVDGFPVLSCDVLFLLMMQNSSQYLCLLSKLKFSLSLLLVSLFPTFAHYLQVLDQSSPDAVSLRKRLMEENAPLSIDDRAKIMAHILDLSSKL